MGGTVVTGGSSAHVVLLGVPWRVAVFAGAAALIVAGLLTAWQGMRWPVMSGRYERSAQADRPERPRRHAAAPVPPAGMALDAAGLWDSISRGDDPTVGPPAGPPSHGTGGQFASLTGAAPCRLSYCWPSTSPKSPSSRGATWPGPT